MFSVYKGFNNELIFGNSVCVTYTQENKVNALENAYKIFQNRKR